MAEKPKVKVTIEGREVEIEELGSPPEATIYLRDGGMFIDVEDWPAFVAGVNEAIRAYRALEAIGLSSD